MRTPLILVVDDNDLLRFAYRILLQKAGFEVIDAPNGSVGLERARARLPDLVLLDLDMPVLNGWQTMAVLRRDARTAEIPVIANTGETRRGIVEEARGAGFWGYAGKDLTAEALIAYVRSALARSDAGEGWVGCALAPVSPARPAGRGDSGAPPAGGGMQARANG